LGSILEHDNIDVRHFHRKRDADPTSSAASCVGMMRVDEHRSI
jgi:hypothetical protein